MSAATPEWAVAKRRDLGSLDESPVGSWESVVVPATRGLPHTDFATRRIAVPAGDHPTAKVVRAHELVHASISPMNLTDDIIRQLELTPTSIALAEEMRVNYVLSTHAEKLKVDMKAMKDGSEHRDVQAAIQGKDFVTVLSTVCATMFAGAERAVAREAQAAYPVIREFRKQVKRILKYDKSATSATTSTQLNYVEVVERIEVPNGDPDDNGHGFRESYGTIPLPMGFANVTLDLARMIESMLPRKGEGSGEYEERLESMNNDAKSGEGEHSGRWGHLRFAPIPLNGNGSGFLSRTRRASSLGRSPRRLHRILTDPERRVFDRLARKSGGVVLVDGSGSMSLTSDDLRDIVQAAPGCLVAVYSYNGAGEPNIWVVARNGRYALPIDFPKIGNDNAVDVPALNWAVSQRQRRDDPVIWVSDGHVTIPRFGVTIPAAYDAVRACRAGRVVQVYNVEGALSLLREAANGKRPEPAFVGWLASIANTLDSMQGKKGE